MRKARAIILFLLIIVFIGGCSRGRVSDVKIDLGKSEIYSQEDLQDAVDVIISEIGGWSSVKEVYSVSYCGDESASSQLEYCKSLSEDREYTKCVVFESSFRTTDSAGSDGFNENSLYDGWKWYLAKTDGGQWELVTWGYA